MRSEQRRSGEQEYYKLTEEQVLLIRQMHINMDDGSCLGYEGGPCVNSKRPFGNSNVEYDVYEIIDPRPYDVMTDEDGIAYNEEENEDAFEDFQDMQREIYERWYPTLPGALQVILSSGSFEPGIYSCNKYCSNYRLVTDENEIFKAELILGNKDVHTDPRYSYV